MAQNQQEQLTPKQFEEMRHDLYMSMMEAIHGSDPRSQQDAEACYERMRQQEAAYCNSMQSMSKGFAGGFSEMKQQQVQDMRYMGRQQSRGGMSQGGKKNRELPRYDAAQSRRKQAQGQREEDNGFGY